MAVTVQILTRAVRAGTDTDTQAELTRLLGVAQAIVGAYIGTATVPDAVKDEATIRVVGFLFDAPMAGRSTLYANALRSSGALGLLAPYRVHRAGSIEAAAAADDGGGADLAALTARVAALEANQLPGGGEVDQVLARTSGGRGWRAVFDLLPEIGLSKLTSAVRALLLPTGGSVGQVPTKTSTGVEWQSASGGALTTAQQKMLAAAFAEAFEETLSRPLVANLTNADGEAILTQPTGVDQDRELAVDYADSDGTDRAEWLKSVGVGDWIYLVAGTKALLFQVEAASDDSGNSVRKFLFTNANAVATGGGFALTTAVSDVSILFGGKDLNGLMLRDASNADSGAYSNLAGTDEPKTFTGYTRAGANSGNLTGTGEWFGTADNDTTTGIFVKAGELAQMRKRIKVGHILQFGDGYQVEVKSNVYEYASGSGKIIQFIQNNVVGTIPAVNASTVLRALGDNIHRNEVSKAALKATLPAAGKWLKVNSGGTDVEGVDAPRQLPATDVDGERGYVLKRKAAADGVLFAAESSGGGSGSWAKVGDKIQSSNLAANTTVDLGLDSFPILGAADYAALRTKLTDGTIKHVAIKITQNDTGDVDSDGGVFVFPNALPFRDGSYNFDIWPAWNFNVNPTRVRVSWESTKITLQMDAAYTGPTLSVVVAVFG